RSRRWLPARPGRERTRAGAPPAPPKLYLPREGKAFTLWPDMHIHPILGHVNANEVLHIPSLRMRARLAAPATVRADRTGGWGAVLRNGLVDPRSLWAPIRHRDTFFTAASR